MSASGPPRGAVGSSSGRLPDELWTPASSRGAVGARHPPAGCSLAARRLSPHLPSGGAHRFPLPRMATCHQGLVPISRRCRSRYPLRRQVPSARHRPCLPFWACQEEGSSRGCDHSNTCPSGNHKAARLFVSWNHGVAAVHWRSSRLAPECPTGSV